MLFHKNPICTHWFGIFYMCKIRSIWKSIKCFFIFILLPWLIKQHTIRLAVAPPSRHRSNLCLERFCRVLTLPAYERWAAHELQQLRFMSKSAQRSKRRGQSPLLAFPSHQPFALFTCTVLFHLQLSTDITTTSNWQLMWGKWMRSFIRRKKKGIFCPGLTLHPNHYKGFEILYI